jgi:hypothetical protein
MPFIAGYAHLADWKSAVELTAKVYESNPKLKDYFCSQWYYLVQEIPASEGRDAAAKEIYLRLGCPFP